MRKGTVAVVALGVLLIAVAAGCGSKKSSTGTTTNTAAAQGSRSGSGSGGSSGKPSFASTSNCKQLESLAAKVAQSVQPNANGEVDLSKEADALDALADAAPSEIKGDFHTFAEAFKNFAKAYGDAKIKIGQVPSAAQIAKMTTAAKSLEEPKVKAAMQHLSAWGNSHCSGLSSTSP